MTVLDFRHVIQLWQENGLISIILQKHFWVELITYHPIFSFTSPLPISDLQGYPIFYKTALRIHLILRWIRIQVISLRFTEFFVLFFSHIFILKLEPFRNEEIFTISLFLKVQIWVLGVKVFFSVLGWYFTPWFRIRGSAYFCGYGSSKPKSCISNGSGS